jgi:glycosyltransferase involved in cell wall biosynthesis
MKDPTALEVSLVLPCYNECEGIRGVLASSVAALKRLGRSWEILVVDNHSDDATPDAVRRFMHNEPGVRLIVHPSNRLYSGSCATGLRESRGRLVAIMDSDGQFTAEDLPKFIAALELGANLVFGWRKHRRDPLSRKVLSWVFNAMAKRMLSFPHHDLNVGIRMFDRRFMAAAHIEHAINFANPEFYVCARRSGLRVGEVEVQHFARERGRSCHNFRRQFQLFLTVYRYFRSLHARLDSPVIPSESIIASVPRQAPLVQRQVG